MDLTALDFSHEFYWTGMNTAKFWSIGGRLFSQKDSRQMDREDAAELARALTAQRQISKPKEDMMRLIYGMGISLPVETSAKPIPSPQQSIERAGQYVMKMKQKGFCRIDDGITSPSEIYTDPWAGKSQRTSQRTTARVTTRQTERSVKVQPYQEFWLNTEAVKRVINELLAMKFRNGTEQANAVKKFKERIMKVTGIMKDHGMLETRNKSKQDLQSTMNWFIEKVKEERTQLIRSCLAFNKLPWSGMNKDQQNEFPEFAPKRPAAQQQTKVERDTDGYTEIDHAVMTKYLDSVIVLPKGYRMGTSYITERPSTRASVFTRKEMQEVDRRVCEQINRPRTASKRDVIVEPLVAPTVTKKRSNAMVILNTRPRAGTLPRRVNPPSVLSRTASEHPIEDVKETVKVAEPEDVSVQPTPMSEVVNEVTESKKSVTEAPEQVERIAPQEIAQVLAKDMKPQYVLQNRNPGDFAFLNEQTDDIVATGEGKQMHERLKKIWDQLGFSVTQKLEMAVKYSNISDDYGRFLNAVQKWEDAFQTFEDYDSAYRDLKDFLRNSSARTDKAHAFRQLKSNFETAETAVRETAALMKAQYDDDLVMRRKLATDLCDSRKFKMQMLMKQQGYATK